MEYQIRVQHEPGTDLVTIKGNCDENAYHLMYQGVCVVLRYRNRMKTEITRDMSTTTSIVKTLKFASSKSADLFIERLPLISG